MLHLWHHVTRTISRGPKYFFRAILGLWVSAIKFALQASLFPFAYLGALAYKSCSGKTPRICIVDTRHLGGWGYSFDGYLRRSRKADAASSCRDLFLVDPREVSNCYFFDLMARSASVITSPMVRMILAPLARFSNQFRLSDYGYLPPRYCINGAVPLSRNLFSAQDESKGELLLQRLGIGPAGWYVCFFARDNVYSEITTSAQSLESYKKYHECRNANIENYLKAIRFVIDKGGYAIRMGSVAQTPIAFSHPHLIDYPFTDHKSPFADIYLACHCKFIIGTGSGIVDLSAISDVPMGLTDYSFYSERFPARSNFLWMPKLLRYRDTGEVVTLKEFFTLLGPVEQHSHIRLIHSVEDSGLEFQDNSADEILAITRALYDRFVEGVVSDAQWDDWQRGCKEALQIDPSCTAWGPFLASHAALFRGHASHRNLGRT